MMPNKINELCFIVECPAPDVAHAFSVLAGTSVPAGRAQPEGRAGTLKRAPQLINNLEALSKN
jgi:hypothetical protein